MMFKRLVPVPFLLILSWVLIHFFALLGVFMSIGYLIWFLFMPERIPCFSCRVRRENDYCPFCKTRVTKSNIHPKNFRSGFLNSFILLVITILSILVVVVETFILKQFGIPPTPQTVSFNIPSKGQYRLGEIFPMDIKMSGIETPINAIQMDMGFDPERLEVLEISTRSSFAKIFLQKDVSNEEGYARLSGGLPNPGLVNEDSNFATIYFRGKIPGITKVELLPSSMVLANDGRGTNVLKDVGYTSYLILPEAITQNESQLQESSLVPAIVSEAKGSSDQMLFFDYAEPLLSQKKPDTTEGAVLGAKTNMWSRYWSSFWNMLYKYNNLVLTFWKNVYNRFFNF